MDLKGGGVDIVHVIKAVVLEEIGRGFIDPDAQEDLLQAGEVEIAEVGIVIVDSVGDIGIGEVGDQVRIGGEDAGIDAGVREVLQEGGAIREGLIHIDRDRLVEMTGLAGEHVGEGGVGAVIAAGGVGIPGPAGEGILQVRPAVQHLPGPGAVRGVNDEDDDVGIGAEVELAPGGEDMILAIFGHLRIHGEGGREEADKLHDDEGGGDGAHGEFGGLPELLREKEDQEDGQESDRDPDEEVHDLAAGREVDRLAGEGRDEAVQEKDLDIGGNAKAQGGRGGDEARAGREEGQ